MKKLLLLVLLVLCGSIAFAQYTVDTWDNLSDFETKEILPGKYDLRDYSYCSPLKNAGKKEYKLAFSVCDSLESNNLFNGNSQIILDEDVIGQAIYDNDIDISTCYLYSGKLLLSNGNVAGVSENFYRFTQYANGTTIGERNSIRSRVLNGGSVVLTFHNNPDCWKGSAYFCKNSSYFGNLDTCTVIGWNDNYSKNNFKETPIENGAYLCKSIYGSSVYDKGYFWISYYDKTIYETGSYDFSPIKSVKYNQVLSHNGTWFPSGYSNESEYSWGKERFNPQTDGTIYGIRTSVPATGVKYKLWIYQNENLVYGPVIIKPEKKGYMSIPVSRPIRYSEDDIIEVVINYNSTSEENMDFVPTNDMYGELDSYISNDGVNWKEMENSIIGIGLLVNAPILTENITLNKSSLTIGVGDKYKLVPTITPSNASDKTLTWESSNSGIVLVDKNGNIKGVKPGVAYVTASTNDTGLSATCKVTVKEILAKSITIDPSELTVYTKEYVTVKGVLSPSNVTNKTILWSSSDKGIAYINSAGKIVGVTEGEAVITGTSKGTPSVKAKCKVHVKWCPPREISLNETELTLVQKESFNLVATLNPSYCKNKTVLWTTSDKSIASVSSKGLVYGGKLGTCVITATAKGDPNVKATCTVTVRTPYPRKIYLNIQRALSLEIGETYQLIPTLEPANVKNKTVLYESSDNSVASVSAKGVITARKKGECMIRATCKDGGAYTEFVLFVD